MFGEKHDLPDVLRVMRQRTIESLKNRVRFLADRDHAFNICGR